MALTITDDCIVCGACDWCCPNDAITSGDLIYIIDPELCTECEGEHPSAECIEACPVECIIPFVEDNGTY